MREKLVIRSKIKFVYLIITIYNDIFIDYKYISISSMDKKIFYILYSSVIMLFILCSLTLFFTLLFLISCYNNLQKL